MRAAFVALWTGFFLAGNLAEAALPFLPAGTAVMSRLSAAGVCGAAGSITALATGTGLPGVSMGFGAKKPSIAAIASACEA